jgi:hypothetical protein
MACFRPVVDCVFSHGFSAHFDAMSVVYQTVEDTVGDGDYQLELRSPEILLFFY